MKSVLRFIINLIITIIVCIPCLLLFDWVEQRNNINWLDVFLLLIGVSVVMTVINKLLQSKKPSRVLKETTVFLITVTVMFGLFTLMEWIFDWAAEKEFVYGWDQKLTLSIAFTVFENLNNWSKRNNLFSRK